MITIWGRATSSNVQTAMWAVAELGLEHQRLDWGGSFGGNDDPDYRDMNPNGLIPVMKDGDHRAFPQHGIAVLHHRYQPIWVHGAVFRVVIPTESPTPIQPLVL